MTRWLHVEASPRGERSRSGQLARRFFDHLQADPQSVETLDLWAADLPPLDGEMIEGRYALIHGQESDPARLSAWAPIIAWTDHFKAFDAYLISTPMWNFSLPYRLKHYIDLLTQPGLTFAATPEGAVEGLVAGRRAVVLSASAWSYEPAGGLADLDFQHTYLKTWLGFIGLTQVDWVHAAPMFGEPAVVEAAMAEALERAEVLARRLAQAPQASG